MTDEALVGVIERLRRTHGHVPDVMAVCNELAGWLRLGRPEREGPFRERRLDNNRYMREYMRDWRRGIKRGARS